MFKFFRLTVCIFFLSVFAFFVYSPSLTIAESNQPTQKDVRVTSISDAFDCLMYCLLNEPFNLNCYVDCLKKLLSPAPIPTLPPAPPPPPNPPVNTPSYVPPTNPPIPTFSSQCEREGGYCSGDRTCPPPYQFMAIEGKGCPVNITYCCQRSSGGVLPTVLPQPPSGVPPIVPPPGESGYISCQGNYSITVQGCKEVFLIGTVCDWVTENGTETLCVKPEQCNISECNRYIAIYGPTIAQKRAVAQGAWIKPGTFSGSCSGIIPGGACYNPTMSTTSLNNQEDWIRLMSLIDRELISPLEVSKLIHEVKEKGKYTPGLQIREIDLDEIQSAF